ncbi:MAG: hypothetical protein EZS28_013256 [Streblomastix strix]|uniref:USP domain-containing protein n=1 Tax=Streblomastix strix TaxID=222440 RepID=A0A5J4W8I2_9EUKA|nr:MAG: hypothetical protein EZS28_013256 [Streblomastix strix]
MDMDKDDNNDSSIKQINSQNPENDKQQQAQLNNNYNSVNNNEHNIEDESEDEDESYDQDSQNPEDYDYILHSVCVHSGDTTGGHYFVYIRPYPAKQEYQQEQEQEKIKRKENQDEEQYGIKEKESVEKDKQQMQKQQQTNQPKYFETNLENLLKSNEKLMEDNIPPQRIISPKQDQYSKVPPPTLLNKFDIDKGKNKEKNQSSTLHNKSKLGPQVNKWYRFNDENVQGVTEYESIWGNYGIEDKKPDNFINNNNLDYQSQLQRQYQLSNKQFSAPQTQNPNQVNQKSAYMLVYIQKKYINDILHYPTELFEKDEQQDAQNQQQNEFKKEIDNKSTLISDDKDLDNKQISNKILSAGIPEDVKLAVKQRQKEESQFYFRIFTTKSIKESRGDILGINEFKNENEEEIEDENYFGLDGYEQNQQTQSQSLSSSSQSSNQSSNHQYISPYQTSFPQIHQSDLVFDESKRLACEIAVDPDKTVLFELKEQIFNYTGIKSDRQRIWILLPQRREYQEINDLIEQNKSYQYSYVDKVNVNGINIAQSNEAKSIKELWNLLKQAIEKDDLYYTELLKPGSISGIGCLESSRTIQQQLERKGERSRKIKEG